MHCKASKIIELLIKKEFQYISDHTLGLLQRLRNVYNRNTYNAKNGNGKVWYCYLFEEEKLNSGNWLDGNEENWPNNLKCDHVKYHGRR